MRTILIAAALLLAWPALVRADTTVAPSMVLPQASLAVETGHVVQASPGTLKGASITTGETAGYFMLFNSITVPSNGAITPIKCVVVAANDSRGISPDPDTQWRFSVGVTLAFSTTGCFTMTQSATAYFSWQQ